MRRYAFQCDSSAMSRTILRVIDSKSQFLETSRNRPNRIDNAPFLREHQDTQRTRDLEACRIGVSARVTVIQHKKTLRRFQPES